MLKRKRNDEDEDETQELEPAVKKAVETLATLDPQSAIFLPQVSPYAQANALHLLEPLAYRHAPQLPQALTCTPGDGGNPAPLRPLRLPPLQTYIPPPPHPNLGGHTTSTPSIAGAAQHRSARVKSRTIERFADILVDLIELQAAKAVTADRAIHRLKTKVDVGIQTAAEATSSVEVGNQTGDDFGQAEIAPQRSQVDHKS